MTRAAALFLAASAAGFLAGAQQAGPSEWDVIRKLMAEGGPLAGDALTLIPLIPDAQAERLVLDVLNGSDATAVAAVARGLSASQCARYLPQLSRAAAGAPAQAAPPIWDAVGRARNTEAASVLAGLAGTKAQPLAGIAFGILGTMGAPAVPALSTMLDHGASADNRETAAYVLLDLDRPEAANAFRAALHDSARKVRFAAALGLARLGFGEGMDELEDGARSGDQTARLYALVALVSLGAARYRQELESILNRGTPAAALRCVTTIAWWGTPSLRPLVFDLGLQKRPEFQQAIAERMLDPARAEDLRALKENLKSPNAAARVAAATKILTVSQDSQAASVITSALIANDEAVKRLAVTWAAQSHRFDQALAGLIASTDPDIRVQALDAAGRLGGRRFVGPAKDALASGILPVSMAAARALASIDPDAGRRSLREGLTSASPQIRLVSAVALLSIAPTERRMMATPVKAPG